MAEERADQTQEEEKLGFLTSGKSSVLLLTSALKLYYLIKRTSAKILEP